MSDESQPTTPMRRGGLDAEGLIAHGMQSTRRTPWTPPTVEELQRALPQYDILALAGRGGMGAVYKARQKRLDRPVAIKVLPAEIEHDEAAYAERFAREARAMARLSHPNIVAVHDAGETSEGLLYFVMDFIEGTDVQRMLAERDRLPLPEALAITTHVLDALGFAHGKGIIHRDIKPSNVLIDAEGNVKVADFGLAKMLSVESSLLTASDVAMGTPAFMAPEAFAGSAKVDHRADLYAVGVMLYQMLTGEIPHGVFDPPSTKVKCAPLVDEIIRCALQADPARRFPSSAEMKAAVDQLRLATKRNVEPANRTNESIRANRRLIFVALLALMLGVGGWFAWKNSHGAGVAPAPSAQRADATPPPRTLDEWKPILARHGVPAERLGKNGYNAAKLDLSRLPIDDLGFIAGIPVEELNIENTAVRDLSPLRGMRLRFFKAAGTSITDLSPLAGMPIEELTLANCAGVTDISVVRGMPVRIFNAPDDVRDWSPLRELPLNNLIINSRNFHEFDLLAGKQFGFLSLHLPTLTDISFLRGQRVLSGLQLNSSGVTDLSPLAGISSLKSLRINGTRVFDLTPLRALKLTEIEATSTPLRSIEPLRGMPLQSVALGSCKELHDLSPLADCATLEQLWIPDEPGEIECLRRLPKLRYIGYQYLKAPGTEHPAMTAEQFWKDYDARKAK